ncbi:MAG: alpha-amylase family glycosyl hydrolase [Parafilimonas sp.]
MLFKKLYVLLAFIFFLPIKKVCAQNTFALPSSNEVIYHIFLRSFYDSNGDGHGDLKGLQSKLGYLQDLGVTSILLTPINSSVYYHNYFSDDFEKIDAEFGTMQDYLDLVNDIHKHGMKIYLDMETQYVTEDHLWWKDSYNNLKSKYSDYILYDDSAHTKPSTIIYNLTGLTGYDNTSGRITTVNLTSKNVLDYNIKLFTHFADPNNDGKFNDGADGFRLDHAMDNLDSKPQLTNLFATFWKPLITHLKQANPKLMIVAEQANWSDYGSDYLLNAGVDRVFAFNLQKAIVSFDKQRLARVIDSTFSQTPSGKQQVFFIENHDMQRFASAVNKDERKLKVAAALNLLIGQVPSIYYGQELGMFGAGGFGKFNSTDGNDIPMREAFEWYKSDSGKGMAIWYKNTGGWWDSTNLKPNDGISLEEEMNDPNSLYNFYKTLLKLRKENTALQSGTYQTFANNNDNVFSFLRSDKNETLIVVINLSADTQPMTFDFTGTKIFKASQIMSIYEIGKKTISSLSTLSLQPYEVQIWKAQ